MNPQMNYGPPQPQMPPTSGGAGWPPTNVRINCANLNFVINFHFHL